jgi:predicted SPOUT superfamily RNA methylase MTH1
LEQSVLPTQTKKMNTKHTAVAIPGSMISDTPHLREKTAKIGYVGRAAAIFRVNEIIIYADNQKVNQKNDLSLIELLLSYMETPQYLRRILFERKPELQFAGILPPLRTPNHPLTGRIRDLKIGDYREGVAISKSNEGTLVEIGSERPAVLSKAQVSVNKRLTVKITKITDHVEVQIANRKEVPEYWGYEISTEHRSLSTFLNSRRFDLTVGTSKIADRFQEVSNALIARWKGANSIVLLFGAPTRGLFEIAKDQGTNLSDNVDFLLNTIPNQGTETVRTEEALLATLAILNVQFDF